MKRKSDAPSSNELAPPNDELAPSSNELAPARMVVRASVLVTSLLCFLPPLFLSNRLPTLHTLSDSKWLVVVFLAACQAFLTVLIYTLWSPTPHLSHSPLRGALLLGAVAFFAAHLLSAALCPQPAFSMRSTLPLLAMIVLFGTIVWQPPRLPDIRKFSIVMVGTGALIGVLALVQYAGFDLLAPWVRYREPTRYRTGLYVTLGNPEYLGGYLAPLAIAALGLALSSSGRWVRGAGLAGAILTAIPALLTGSRGAFLGMVGAGVVLLIGALALLPRLSRRTRIAAFAVGGVILVGIVVGLSLSPRQSTLGFLRRRLTELAHPYSDSIRTRIVFNLVGVKMVANHPVLGIGPGMLGIQFYPALLELLRPTRPAVSDVFERDFNGIVAEHAHNDWLEIWVTTGTLGFAAWLWIIVVWLVSLARALVRPLLAPTEQLFMLTLASAAIALLVNGLFNFPLYDPVRSTLLWLTLAWSASFAFSEKGTPAASPVLLSSF